jgi:hypothetical protein
LAISESLRGIVAAIIDRLARLHQMRPQRPALHGAGADARGRGAKIAARPISNMASQICVQF